MYRKVTRQVRRLPQNSLAQPIASQMQWNSLSFLSRSKVSMKKSESVSEEPRRVAHASDDR